MFSFLNISTENVINYTPTSIAEFVVLVCLSLYLHDDDPLEVETSTRDIVGK